MLYVCIMKACLHVCNATSCMYIMYAMQVHNALVLSVFVLCHCVFLFMYTCPCLLSLETKVVYKSTVIC